MARRSVGISGWRHFIYFTARRTISSLEPLWAVARPSQQLELAMLHLSNTQPDMKVIYIAPSKALLKVRMDDWQKPLYQLSGKN
ncbi:unnamed protein product [Calypogeia fissa]